MDKFQRINNIKKHYAFNRDTDFAKFLGISPQVLYNWKARNTFDTELVYEKCYDINPEWLLTGKGNMLKIGSNANRGIDKSTFIDNAAHIFDGFSIGDFKFMEYENERFLIPTFKESDTLVQVKGDAMYPKYNNGDIVACKKLTVDGLFFQWDKVYVLDTSQGSLIKRIKKGKDSEHILLVSENDNFEAFELNISNIFGVSLVVGVIRLV
ncbi:MAG: hypothetical protein RL308_2549 [Bacteroidota bacterium]|jgi:repressor LexA